MAFAGALPCLGLWIWMVFLVVSFYARGGLIAGYSRWRMRAASGFAGRCRPAAKDMER